jgi:hypothetical protein
MSVFGSRLGSEDELAMFTVLVGSTQHWVFDVPVLSQKMRKCTMSDDDNLFHQYSATTPN